MPSILDARHLDKTSLKTSRAVFVDLGFAFRVEELRSFQGSLESSVAGSGKSTVEYLRSAELGNANGETGGQCNANQYLEP